MSRHSRPGDGASARRHGQVSLDGVTKVVSTALVEDLKVGDYVVLHVGYALSKIDPEEAARTLELFASAGEGPA